MKVFIEPTPYYFGTHRWYLHVDFGKNGGHKSFFLGQDCKFTSRVLGWEIDDFFTFMRIKKWSKWNSKRVANYIVRELKLTPSILKRLQEWELSCE